MPVECDALIDSGATVTAIDFSVAEKLGLQPSGIVTGVGIGGESRGFIAACSVDIHGLSINIPRCHCHDLSKVTNRFMALIGRDVLRHMVFHYDGPNGNIYLEVVGHPSPSLQRPKTQTRRAKRKPKRKRRK